MKKTFSKLALSLTLVAVTIFGSNAVTTYAKSNTVNVAIDGRIQIFPDVEPYIDNNARTQVPIRFVSEKLGADVNWNGSTQTSTIKKDGKTVQMVIGQNKIIVDGVTKAMDTSPTLYQGRTVVPLRFVSEGLGVDVLWNADKNLVEITTENNGTLAEPKFDVRDSGSTDGYGTSFDSIEFPVRWAKDIGRKNGEDYIIREGIIYDITLKNGNEVWITTNQYLGSINVAGEPVLEYASVTFYNTANGTKKPMLYPVGTFKENNPQIIYNEDGTITYQLEENSGQFKYTNYDRICLGTRFGKINIPVSSLL